MEPELVMWNTPELIFSSHISIQKCLMWSLILQPEILNENNKQNLFPIECISSVQFNSVTQSCLALCDPRDCSMPGLPVHHQLPEFTQTHVHWVRDAIQTSHPLSSPSYLAFSHFQHQGLFKWVSSLHQVAKVMAFQLQHQSFQWTPRTPLGWTGWISMKSEGLSRVFSNTTVQKHQFFQKHSAFFMV